MGQRKLVNTVQFSAKQLENKDSNKKELAPVAKALRSHGTTIKKKA